MKAFFRLFGQSILFNFLLGSSLRRVFSSSLSVFLLTFFLVESLQAKDTPKNWPWKGVVVDNLTTTPEQLVTLKNELPGMNSIRLTLLARQTAELNRLPPDEAWQDMVSWTHKMLDVCARLGISAVLSTHEFPTDPAVPVNQTSPKFWSSPIHINMMLSYVDRMSKEFAMRGDELTAFEILSEPVVLVNNQPQLPVQWPALIQKILATIRANSNKWVVVTPGLGGIPGGYSNFRPLDDKRIIYGTHMYQPWTYTLQGIDNRPFGLSYPGRIQLTYWDKNQISNVFAPLRTFQLKYEVPVWVGEFSAARWAKGSNKYLQDVIDHCKLYSWGWAYFSIGNFHAWDPDYDSNYPTIETPPRKAGHTSERWLMLKTILGNNTLNIGSDAPKSEEPRDERTPYN